MFESMLFILAAMVFMSKIENAERDRRRLIKATEEAAFEARKARMNALR